MATRAHPAAVFLSVSPHARRTWTRPDATSPWRAGLADPTLAIVVAVALAVDLFGVTWGLPNVVDWAIDSIAPLGPLAYAYHMLHGGDWWSKYPPLHFTILAIVDAPYLALLHARGALHAMRPEFPYGFTQPAESLGHLVLIARVVSAIMSAGATAAAWYIARELHGRRAGLIAGLLFAAAPLSVYYSGTGNLDMPYMFWSALALAALVRVARGGTIGAHVALGVFSALAVATKDQAFGLFVLLPIPLLVARRREIGSRAWRDRRLLAGLATAVVTYAVAANVLVDWRGWVAHLHWITHEGSVPFRMFPRTLDGYAALVRRTAALTVESATWPTTVLGVVGCVLALRQRLRGAGLLMLAPLFYFAAFVVPILYVFPRFVLPAVFVLAIFAGIAGAWLWETRATWARVAVVATVGYAFVLGASIDVGLLRDSRYAAESWMAQWIPPGATVGTNGDPTYLPRLPAGVHVVPVELDRSGVVSAGAPPDFLVLSSAFYRRYLRHADTRPVLRKLFGGHLGYEHVATFHRRGLPATELIPTLNPRIVILRRRPDVAVGSTVRRRHVADATISAAPVSG